MTLPAGTQSALMTYRQLERTFGFDLGESVNRQVTALFCSIRLSNGARVYELWDMYVKPGRVVLRCVGCNRITEVCTGPNTDSTRHLHFSIENRWVWASCGRPYCDTMAEHLFDSTLFDETSFRQQATLSLHNRITLAAVAAGMPPTDMDGLMG
jgi:hypothetical protein